MKDDGDIGDALVGALSVPGEWYVAFYSNDERHWWEWLDLPGFGHCMCFAYSVAADRWLVYDVTRHRTFVHALAPEVFGHWLALCNQVFAPVRILKVPTAPLERRKTERVGFWCTVAVKHLVGIRSRALRPKALFRDLLAQGADFAFDTGPGHEDEGCHSDCGDGPGASGARAGTGAG